tara:strand:+ start:684 stop:923 length:240 start_codon:yes stop_codon:yes gene_type:complete
MSEDSDWLKAHGHLPENNPRDKLNSGDPDWWKISVFHRKEYWETMKRAVDQEQGICSPLEELKKQICTSKLNEIIEKNE